MMRCVRTAARLVFLLAAGASPIAAALVASSYSRTEESAADRHGVDILTSAGFPKAVMNDTLIRLVQAEGASSGAILAGHSGTQERIDAL